MLDVVLKYYPDWTATQLGQLEQLDGLYRKWNAKINVISRKDIDYLYLHHVLHALSIGRAMPFQPNSRILDLGTGGGFPGIPLAIRFPEVHFTLIDGTRKKIQVVREIVEALGLTNVHARQIRAEEWKGEKFDFVVSRAVASLDKLVEWSFPLLSRHERNIFPNGLWTLKGGRVEDEIQSLPNPGEHYWEVIPLSEVYEEAWFEEKYLLYLQGA